MVADRALDGGDGARAHRPGAKHPGAFRTISEVAIELDVPQHVLRFWETKFPQIKPMKRGGGRRYYRPEDVALLRGIRHLLYSDGYTIKGVQKVLRENGAHAVISVAKPLAERLAEHRAQPPIVALSFEDDELADPAGPVDDFPGDSDPEPAEVEMLHESHAADPAGDEVEQLRRLIRDLRAELAEIRAVLHGKSEG